MYKLIVLEGIDGVGKTTLSKMLVQNFKKNGLSAVRYEDFEDNHSFFNEHKILIKDQYSKTVSLYFYLASAIAKSEIIAELLNEQHVICDRYVYSTLAYHCAVGAEKAGLIHPDLLPIKIPDHHFLVTAEETIRLARVTQKDNPEEEDFQDKSRGSFFDIFEKKLKTFNPILIDSTTQNPEETLLELNSHIQII